MTQVRKGNVSAITFALRNLGYDGMQSIPEEKAPEQDPNTVDLKGCTLTEMKQVMRIAEAVKKRKDKNGESHT